MHEHGRGDGGGKIGGGTAATSAMSPGKRSLTEALPEGETVGRGGTTPSGATAPAASGGGARGRGGRGGIRVQNYSMARDNASMSRTRVGVGEQVTFTAPSRGGTLSADRAHEQTPGEAGGRAQLVWRAPETAGAATITYQPEGAGDPQTVEMTVVAPSSATFVPNGTFAMAAAGAGMENLVDVGPFDVSFEGAQWQELGGAAAAPKAVTGYFARYRAMGGDLNHHPNPNWIQINSLLNDRAAIGGLPPIAGGRWADGSFHWEIPNAYRVIGSSSAGHTFTKVQQGFQITEAGVVTVTKGGQTVTSAAGTAASATGASPDERAQYTASLQGEGLELLLNRLRQAPDATTRQVIIDVITARAPTIQLAVRCNNKFSWITRDGITVQVNDRAPAPSALALDTNEDGVVTIPFATAFPLPGLANTTGQPPVRVVVEVEGQRFEAHFNQVFGGTGDFVDIPGAERRYQLRYQLQNAAGTNSAAAAATPPGSPAPASGSRPPAGPAPASP